MNADAVRSRKGLSAKGVTKSIKLNFLPGGGSLDLTVKLPMTSSPRNSNAVERMAQPKPMRTTRRSTMMGRTTPPMLDPAVTMPKARARCARNQVPRAAIAISGCLLNLMDMGETHWIAVGIHTGIEEKRAAKGTANALGEENLVVLLGD